MAKLGCLLVVLATIACQLAQASSNKQQIQRICYHTNWATYRKGIGHFTPADVNANLCTIINYAFVGLWGETGELRVLDSYSDEDLGNLKGVVALKKVNPDLKVLVSMGGWNEGGKNYSKVAGNAKLRKNLITSVLSYIEEHNLNGFDLDWEYPANVERGGDKKDVENFITLLKELADALHPKGHILTVAVAGTGKQVTESYNVPELSKYADFINIMEYDYRTAGTDNFTAHHSPLFHSSLDKTSDQRALSVSAGIQQWLKLGANPSKLIVGIPSYGHSYVLADAKKNGLYAATKGPAPAGKVTGEAGVLSFQEICYYFKDAIIVFDGEQQAPHGYLGTTWFAFDNVESVKFKVKYALEQKLGGVMFYALDFDDFNDSCGYGKYPLLNAINDEISLRTSK